MWSSYELEELFRYNDAIIRNLIINTQSLKSHCLLRVLKKSVSSTWRSTASCSRSWIRRRHVFTVVASSAALQLRMLRLQRYRHFKTVHHWKRQDSRITGTKARYQRQLALAKLAICLWFRTLTTISEVIVILLQRIKNLGKLGDKVSLVTAVTSLSLKVKQLQLQHCCFWSSSCWTWEARSWAAAQARAEQLNEVNIVITLVTKVNSSVLSVLVTSLNECWSYSWPCRSSFT